MDQDTSHLLAIGRFAKASHLSLKALRLYDQRKILQPAYIDPDSGYRYYHIEQLSTARLIRNMRQMEMPLAMIQEVLSTDSKEMAIKIVNGHVRSMKQRLAVINSASRSLISHLTHQEEVTMTFEIDVKDVVPQQIVSISKHVYIDQLDSHVGGSVNFLTEFVKKQDGEIIGPPLGIYHGPVNREDNGPVEVCLPVRGKFTATGEVVVRERSGGSLAYVTLKDEQCHFPAILEAYDALHDWITEKGYDITEPPREIWLSDDDEQIEVAWPFRARA